MRVPFVLVVAAAMLAAVPPGAAAQNGALQGRWAIDRSLSEFPKEIGFGSDMLPPERSDSGAPAPAQGGRRRSGGSVPGGPFSGRQESPDDAARLKILTAELRNPPERLTIEQTPAAVTITDDKGRSRTFHPGVRQDVIRVDDVPVATAARWEAGRLVIVYQVEEGRELRYAYSTSTNPTELVVDVQVVERGGHDSARRIYVPSNASTDAAAAPVQTPAAPAEPKPSPAGGPPVDQRPGADLKGIKTLAVVVEELDDVSKACGLAQASLEAAASKPLTDAGLQLVHRSDEDTYLYVNVMTSRATNGLCVSRYDVSINTHTTAKLSYGSAPVLVEATLLHKGGLAGGAAAVHADAVVNGVKDYAAAFAARIRDANR
jgi:hypothetical protein